MQPWAVHAAQSLRKELHELELTTKGGGGDDGASCAGAGGQPTVLGFCWQYAWTVIPWVHERHAAVMAKQHGRGACPRACASSRASRIPRTGARWPGSIEKRCQGGVPHPRVLSSRYQTWPPDLPKFWAM